MTSLLIRIILALAISTILLTASTIESPAQWTKTFDGDKRGILLIRVDWFKDGSLDGTTGTGFALAATGPILTVAHIFPELSPNDRILITAETESMVNRYPAQSFPVDIEYIDRATDVALLRIRKAGPILIPSAVSWKTVPRISDEVMAYGYPRGGTLTATWGRIVQEREDLVASTDAIIQTGYSGAPVYSTSGEIIGLVLGGESIASINDPNIIGYGKFLILGRIKGTNKAFARLLNNIGTETGAVQIPPEAATNRQIKLNYTVDFTNDNHPSVTPSAREFFQQINAQPGYKIVDVQRIDYSTNKVRGVRLFISPDKQVVNFTVTLESGPLFDRYRGWYKGVLITTQEPV